jgi:hypothetical protein
MFLRLTRKHSLRFITMPLSLPIFLISVLNRNVFIHQVLPVHVRDCVVWGFECGVRDEAVAFWEAGFVARDFWGGLQGAEAGEGVVEGFFVDEGVQVADEEFGAYFDGLLFVCWGLFYALAFSCLEIGMRGEGREYTLFTRIGLPYNRTWFMIRAAYSASSSLMNSTKP